MKEASVRFLSIQIPEANQTLAIQHNSNTYPIIRQGKTEIYTFCDQKVNHVILKELQTQPPHPSSPKIVTTN
jgi:hypothetical protein